MVKKTIVTVVLSTMAVAGLLWWLPQLSGRAVSLDSMGVSLVAVAVICLLWQNQGRQTAPLDIGQVRQIEFQTCPRGVPAVILTDRETVDRIGAMLDGLAATRSPQRLSNSAEQGYCFRLQGEKDYWTVELNEKSLYVAKGWRGGGYYAADYLGLCALLARTCREHRVAEGKR